MAFLLNKKNQAKPSNIVLWIVVIVVSFLFTIFATIPSTNKWLDLRANINTLNEVNLNFENEISRKKKQLDTIEEDFNRIAKDFLKEEKALFPNNIDTNKIARVFELYSIQYSLIDSTSLFDLESISFSTQSSENYTKTSVNMSIISTKDSLKDFIYLIQSNQLPVKMLNAQNSSTSLLASDISTVKFLRGNILPIANIESIISSKDDEAIGDENGLMNTDIQINFFSQKATNE